jgi:hypothetical protein
MGLAGVLGDVGVHLVNNIGTDGGGEHSGEGDLRGDRVSDLGVEYGDKGAGHFFSMEVCLSVDHGVR